MIVLGIDLGKDLVGIGIVEQVHNKGMSIVEQFYTHNKAIDAFTVNLKSAVVGVQKAIEDKRKARHLRRSNQWYRKPKSKERRAFTVTGAIYKNAKGKNDGLHKRCKYTDFTGECGLHTPKMENIDNLRMQDILDHIPGHIREDLKEDVNKYRPINVKKELYNILLELKVDKNLIDGVIDNKDVKLITDDVKREKYESGKKELDKKIRGHRKKFTTKLSKKYDVNYYTVKQLIDIKFGQTNNRAEFCKNHFLAHHEQTSIPRKIAWLPPSEKYRTELIIKEIRMRIRYKGIGKIDKIVIEVGKFDLQKIKKGEALSPEEYQEGEKLGYTNLKSALFYEQLSLDKSDKGKYAKCAYCGKKSKNKKLELDHIYPRGYKKFNAWENLVLACRPCNKKKNKRTPEEAGMKTPAKFSLEKSRAYEKAVKSMQASTYLMKRLKQEFDVEVEETYGYVTSKFRSMWFGNRKGIEKDKVHSVDGLIIASKKNFINDEANMELKPDIEHLVFEVIVKKYSKNIRQRDTEPYEIKKDTKYLVQKTAVENLKLKQIDYIYDEKCKNAVKNLVCFYEDESVIIKDILVEKLTNKDKELTLKELKADLSKLWFKSVKIGKKGLGISQMVKIKNGYYRPAIKGTYGIVYKLNGKLFEYLYKNPLYYKNEKFEADKILMRIKRNDIITIKDDDCCLKQIKVIKFYTNNKFEYKYMDEKNDRKTNPSMTFIKAYKRRIK